MKLLTLCAGSYGSILQTNYIKEHFKDLSLVFLYDDFQDPNILTKFYPCKRGETTIPLGAFTPQTFLDFFLVPSYDPRALLSDHIKPNNLPNLTSITPKSALNQLVPNTKIPDVNFESHRGWWIQKPDIGSGGKNVSMFHTNNKRNVDEGFVAQEECDSEELVVDCVSIGRSVYYSPRISFTRLEGRDTLVSFDLTDADYKDIERAILELVKNVNYQGCFNIQFRFHKNGFKVMEIDWRLSGSSIINAQYDTLIKLYFRKLKGIPSLNRIPRFKKRVTPILLRGSINKGAKNVYESSPKLSFPNFNSDLFSSRSSYRVSS